MSDNKVERILMGTVVSAGRDKTIAVKIERKVRHPIYKKFIKRSTKVHAHDENSNYNVGDNVAIQESRPFSKLKRWIVLNNLDQGEQQ